MRFKEVVAGCLLYEKHLDTDRNITVPEYSVPYRIIMQNLLTVGRLPLIDFESQRTQKKDVQTKVETITLK